MQPSNDLTTGDIGEHLKRMALPAAIGLFFQAMYNATDAYYVGQLSVTALAAVSISFPIYFLILSVGSGLSVAANALSSKARGEKNAGQARRIATQSILFAIVLSVLASIVGLATSDAVFDTIGAKAELHALSTEYMNVIYIGLLFFFLAMVLNGLLNSTGDTKTFGYTLVFGFFLNIVLDPLLMYGWFGLPALGVAGVAWATVITQALNSAVLLYVVIKRNILGGIQAPDFASWWELCTQGVPIMLQHSSVSMGFLIITRFVSDFGENALATFGIGTRVDQLIVLPAIGIATAVVPLVGQNFGAKRLDRVWAIYSAALKYALALLLVGIVIIFIFAENLAAIFTRDVAVISMTSYYLRITALSYIATAIGIISASVLQGLIKAHLSLVFTILRFFIVGIPAIMLFAYFFRLREIGIWIAILLSSLVVAGFGYFYVRRTVQKLTAPEEQSL